MSADRWVGGYDLAYPVEAGRASRFSLVGLRDGVPGDYRAARVFYWVFCVGGYRCLSPSLTFLTGDLRGLGSRIPGEPPNLGAVAGVGTGR